MKGTDVIIEKGAINRLNAVMGAYVAEGAKVMVVEDRYTKDCVRRVLAEKYRIQTVYTHDGALPEEDVKAVLSVGGEEACAAGKAVAARFKLAHVYFCAFPTCTLSANAPVALILDTELIATDDALVAGGFGEVVSVLSALFDAEIAGLLYGERFDAAVARRAFDAVKTAISCAQNGTLTPEQIARLVIDVACARSRWKTLCAGGETQIARALKVINGRKARKRGEYAMLASTCVMSVYLEFLQLSRYDFTAVPDNLHRAACLMGMGVPARQAFKQSYGYVESEQIRRRAFILKEYSRELTARAQSYLKVLCFALKHFKRLYNDKGYEYNNCVGGDTLKTCVALAPDVLHGNTLLSFMRSSGVLDELLKN